MTRGNENYIIKARNVGISDDRFFKLKDGTDY